MTVLSWGGVAAAVVIAALTLWATWEETRDPDARFRREWWQKRERR